jgi:hypothetical protein
MTRLPFINTIEEEGNDIYRREINQKAICEVITNNELNFLQRYGKDLRYARKFVIEHYFCG